MLNYNTDNKLDNSSLLARKLTLRAGESILFSGSLYAARDQAHLRLCGLLARKAKLPCTLADQIIYYCGPARTPRGFIIGSCGPTTSSRMDGFLEPLLKAGLAVTIGKGRRSALARRLIQKHRALYLVAPAGCGALLQSKVVAQKVVAFSDLGAEAIFRLRVADFPLIVAIDAEGNSIYPDIGE